MDKTADGGSPGSVGGRMGGPVAVPTSLNVVEAVDLDRTLEVARLRSYRPRLRLLGRACRQAFIAPTDRERSEGILTM